MPKPFIIAHHGMAITIAYCWKGDGGVRAVSVRCDVVLGFIAVKDLSEWLVKAADWIHGDPSWHGRRADGGKGITKL